MTKGNVKSANNIDKNIGRKIYELRLSSGKTRQDVGCIIGVTHQQLQKYENGINRISASRLHEVAKFFNVPVAYFFEDVQEDVSKEKLDRQRLCIEVMKDFQAIDTSDKQEAVRHIIRAMIAE